MKGLVVLWEVRGGTDGFARSYNVIPAWHLHAEILGGDVVREKFVELGCGEAYYCNWYCGGIWKDEFHFIKYASSTVVLCYVHPRALSDVGHIWENELQLTGFELGRDLIPSCTAVISQRGSKICSIRWFFSPGAAHCLPFCALGHSNCGSIEYLPVSKTVGPYYCSCMLL